MTGNSSPSLSLAGRVAIVTGGTRGIGLATAETFAENGAKVVAVGRSRRAAPDTSHLTGSIETAVCDVASERDVDLLFNSVADRFGSIDVLVNNAGIATDAVIHRGDLEVFRRTLEVNLTGAWLCTRSMLRHQRESDRNGSVVSVGSIAAKAGNFGQAAYSASKAGLEALTKVTAREGAKYGLRANAIRPGLITTDMTDGMTEQWWQSKLATIPMGRAGLPHEVAGVALFLASDLASYVTGSVVDVAGGREM